MPEKNLPARAEKQIAQPPPTIGKEVDLFVKQIDGLADTLPLAARAIQAANQTARVEFERFIDTECEHIEKDGRTGIRIQRGHIMRYRRLKGRVQKSALARQLVPNSILVALVSQFDAFLGHLIGHLFEIKPEILNSSANTLTFSQLVEFGSLSNAREYIVEKEIETVLRKSHAEQFEWLENKFGLPLRTNLEAWPAFIELTERRNLFVHTGGMVSRQYMETCAKHKATLGEGVYPGKTLSVTREYFESAHACLFEIGMKLAQVLWRKLKPTELPEADSSLTAVCYELLSEGRYKLARVLSDFGTETLKKHSSEQSRLVQVMNRAQAYKWTGDEEGARGIISKEDWTATAEKFKLAQAVILDRFEEAIEIMRRIGADGEVNKNDYRDWPLFKEIRKTQQFAEVFEEIFHEPLDTVTLDPKGE